jgi:hypothetical protein
MRLAARRVLVLALVASGACSPEKRADGPHLQPLESVEVTSAPRSVSEQQAAQDPWSVAEFDGLVMRHEGCYGSCPQYEIEFRRGGSARWIGMAYTPRDGAFQGEVHVQDYLRLCRAAADAGLMGLEPSYWTREMHPPRVVVEWSLAELQGAVRADGLGAGTPESFRSFCTLFDEIASRVEWRPFGESR